MIAIPVQSVLGSALVRMWGKRRVTHRTSSTVTVYAMAEAQKDMPVVRKSTKSINGAQRSRPLESLPLPACCSAARYTVAAPQGMTRSRLHWLPPVWLSRTHDSIFSADQVFIHGTTHDSYHSCSCICHIDRLQAAIISI